MKSLLEHLSLAVLCLFCLLLFSPANSLSGEIHKEFNIKKDRVGKGNLFNLIFGTPPPMATERGILIIDAFEDKNGNSQKDPGEEDISGEISCRLDGIEYPIPAFIPGLKYEGSYAVLCQGKTFEPTFSEKDIVIDHRGQIIRIALPCRRSPSGPKSLPEE